MLELSDAIEEVKTTCHFCNKKAVLNLKHVNGRGDFTGPVVQLGAEELYFPSCFPCYHISLNDSGQLPHYWKLVRSIKDDVVST